MDDHKTVTLIGTVINDPELKESPKAVYIRLNVLSRIPVNKSFRKEWTDCVAFGNIAKQSSEQIKKGSKVSIAGSCQTNSFKKKDGTEGKSTSVVISEIKIIAHSDPTYSTQLIMRDLDDLTL